MEVIKHNPSIKKLNLVVSATYSVLWRLKYPDTPVARSARQNINHHFSNDFILFLATFTLVIWCTFTWIANTILSLTMLVITHIFLYLIVITTIYNVGGKVGGKFSSMRHSRKPLFCGEFVDYTFYKVLHSLQFWSFKNTSFN